MFMTGAFKPGPFAPAAFTRATRAGWGAALAVTILAGCATTEAQDFSHRRASGPPEGRMEVVARAQGPIDIAGAPVTMASNNRVETACYDFDMIDVGQAWDAGRVDSGCDIDMRLAADHTYVPIRIRSLIGENSMQGMRDVILASGSQIVSEEEFTVDGVDGYSLWLTTADGFGMKYTIFQLSGEAFALGQEPITGIVVLGYTDDPVHEEMLDAVTSTMEIH